MTNKGIKNKRSPVSVAAAKKSFTEKQPLVAKKKTTALSKKIKRYTKQGVKSLLLSPLFHKTFKVSVAVFISFSFMYGSYLFIGKTFANEVVVSQSEIIARVAKLTTLPEEDPYEIVRVQDSESLKKQNSFYKDVQEGDYILMYKNLAIIYDLRGNRVVAMKKIESN